MIIALGPEVDDHLLLHASVLTAASSFFEAGLKASWTEGLGRAVTDVSTGQNVEVMIYYLYEHDGIYSLGTKPKVSWIRTVTAFEVFTC